MTRMTHCVILGSKGRPGDPMPRTIKRYENRKLYDLEAKRYVSLGDIAGIIRAGDDVVVIDNATGADLTAQTLTKILNEGNAGGPLLSGQSLHNMVRSGKDQVENWFTNFVAGSVERAGVSGRIRREMTELRQRLTALESLVKELEEKEKNDGRNDDGGHRPGRSAH